MARERIYSFAERFDKRRTKQNSLSFLHEVSDLFPDKPYLKKLYGQYKVLTVEEIFSLFPKTADGGVFSAEIIRRKYAEKEFNIQQVIENIPEGTNLGTGVFLKTRDLPSTEMLGDLPLYKLYIQILVNYEASYDAQLFNRLSLYKNCHFEKDSISGDVVERDGLEAESIENILEGLSSEQLLIFTISFTTSILWKSVREAYYLRDIDQYYENQSELKEYFYNSFNVGLSNLINQLKEKIENDIEGFWTNLTRNEIEPLDRQAIIDCLNIFEQKMENLQLRWQEKIKSEFDKNDMLLEQEFIKQREVSEGKNKRSRDVAQIDCSNTIINNEDREVADHFGTEHGGVDVLGAATAVIADERQSKKQRLLNSGLDPDLGTLERLENSRNSSPSEEGGRGVA